MASRLLALVVLCVTLQTAPAAAQDPSSTTTTTVVVPDQEIIPRPNSGDAPHDAGDRGGVLQLAVLGLVVVGIGGAVALVVRQSRRARPDSSSPRPG
jgi:hypothetical protein